MSPLTRAERVRLRLFTRHCKEAAPLLERYVVVDIVSYLGWSAAAGIVAWLLDHEQLAALAAGLGLGLALARLHTWRQYRRDLPLFNTMTNWTKVRHLLDGGH